MAQGTSGMRGELPLLSLAAALTAAAAIAQSPAMPEPGVNHAVTSSEPPSRAASPDEALFFEKCAMCHRQGGMGTGLLSRRMNPAKAKLEDRNDLTSDYITVAVRTGIGNMPRLSRAEVSDPQLAAIARYLTRPKAEAAKR
jgi:mono/diheme cytochrome c family protein